EEIVATVARGGVDHADAAVAAARDAFESGAWSRKSPEERSQIMRKLAERLGEEAEELVALETCANGATVRQADTMYGLTGGVWSSDYEHAIEVADQLRAGTVWINSWHSIDPALPFGGYKQSGLGRELGPHALDEYT